MSSVSEAVAGSVVSLSEVVAGHVEISAGTMLGGLSLPLARTPGEGETTNDAVGISADRKDDAVGGRGRGRDGSRAGRGDLVRGRPVSVSPIHGIWGGPVSLDTV